jgi:16S rRNA (adenine1518-N6/adenine1519-N6)-dimethyltransferase
MAAQPGNKQYGILSVLIQAWYDVEYLFTVEPSVFNPPPKVQSAVIRMTRNKVQKLGCNEQLFKRVVKTVFNQRRKMLRVSLKQLLSQEQLASIATSPFATKRPEQLSIPEFVELTNEIEKVLPVQDAYM